MNKDVHDVNVLFRRRPWYMWILGIIWIIWLLFWIEVSVGSWEEMEYRAFYLSTIVLVSSLIVGLIVNYFASRKWIRRTTSNEES